VSINLSNPTFFVGRNGAGKSNITDALSFLSDAMNFQLRWAIERRGGMQALCTKRADARAGTIAFLVRFGTLPPATPGLWQMPNSPENSSRYSFEIRPLQDGNYEVVREQGVFEGPYRTDWFDLSGDILRSNAEPYRARRGRHYTWTQTGSLVLPTQSGTLIGNTFHILRSVCVYGIEPAAIRALQEPDTSAFLRADGSNAATILDRAAASHPGAIEKIVDLLRSIIPDIADIRTIKFANKKALEFTLAWEGSRITFDANSMSSGSLRAFGLLLAIFQERSPTLLVIEEPENSMHPGATSVLLDVLNYACSRSQVLITTQSPEVLEANWIRDENLRVVSWEGGRTTITDVPQASKTALQEHLMTAGELFRSEAMPASTAGPPPANALSVRICAPSKGQTVGTSVVFRGAGNAFNGIVKRMELWIDGKKVGQNLEDQLKITTTVAAGNHTASMVAVDSFDNHVSSSVSFTVK
jgi:predicted ATPase